MMKKFAVFATSFALFAAIVAPASAQDNSTDRGEAYRAQMEARRASLEATRETREAEINARREALKLKLETEKAQREMFRASTTRPAREDVREKVKGRQASSTARRIAMQQDVAKRKAEHVTKVITATIERLENIILRLESRVTKVKDSGRSTTEAEGYIARAKGDLAEAETSVAAFTGLDLSAEKLQDNFELIRAAAQDAKEHIRSAHTNLMNANRTLGGMRTDGNANSTIESEN